MADAIVEISVRMFFTCDGAGLTPSVAVCFPVASVSEVNWTSVLAELVVRAGDAVVGAPVDNLRPMTQDETAAYRAAENAA